MKFLISLMLVCSFCYGQADLTQDQADKLKSYHEECSKSSGVDPALITKARKGEFVDDDKLKIHLFCVSKKIGFQSEDGKIQQEVLKAKLGPVIGNPEAANSLIAECAKDLANGPETAFQTIKCYYEKTPVHTSIV